MIGRTIQNISIQSPIVILAGVTAAGSLLLALMARSPHWAIFSLFPLAAALMLLFTKDPDFRAEFTMTAIQFPVEGLSLPYNEMQGLAAARPADPRKAGPRNYPIHVIHAAGVVEVPPRLDVRSDDVYYFLYEQFTSSGSRQVNAQLAGHLAQQEQTFGADRVFSYRARAHLGTRFKQRRWRAVLWGWVVVGLTWAGIGVSTGWYGWTIAGLAVAAICGLVIFIIKLEEKAASKVPNWRQSSLVISPTGLAMIQGDHKGQMHWDELRSVKLGAKPGFLDSPGRSMANGLTLVVDGAEFVIADIYDRPLPIIYERIKSYWKP
ncbi:MAG: hypothetical protein AB7K24_29025 [Gemmataceae bacterium]